MHSLFPSVSNIISFLKQQINYIDFNTHHSLGKSKLLGDSIFLQVLVHSETPSPFYNELQYIERKR